METIYSNNEKETMTAKEALAVRLRLRECLLGEPYFYRKVVMVVLPMIIQNTLSNVVGLLDNVMVGQVGTLAMSAVAIVNQLMFVFMLCVWGALAGAGIFGTQFFGKGDYDGVRYTMRIKLIIALVISTASIIIFMVFGRSLASLYISADTPADKAAETLALSANYLYIMLVGLIPFALTQVYSGTLRESGKTTLPMIASITAMIINFIFNLLLIFGYLGFPRLGVAGAAIATVISRFVELGIVAVTAHVRTEEYAFLKGLYKGFYIPAGMIRPVMSKTLPLLTNELLYSMGQAALLQSYSARGIEVIAALNIAGTISMIFNEVFLSLGNATSIVVGQELGAGHFLEARYDAWRMAALSSASCIVMGSLLFASAPFIPRIYNTEADIRLLATQFIRIIAVVMPINSFANVSYFILRSGGRAVATFLFDSCYLWCVSVVAARLLVYFTLLSVTQIFLTVSLLEVIKCIIGFILVKKGVWVRNIVAGTV